MDDATWNDYGWFDMAIIIKYFFKFGVLLKKLKIPQFSFPNKVKKTFFLTIRYKINLIAHPPLFDNEFFN